MNGVEIFNTVYEYDRLISSDWVALVVLITGIIAIAGICTTSFDKAQKVLKILVTISIACVIGSVIGANIETNKIIGTKYQVTISEEVKFNDFMEKYEIVDQDGEIYTVRKRE